jgi:hypothetical protein
MIFLSYTKLLIHWISPILWGVFDAHDASAVSSTVVFSIFFVILLTSLILSECLYYWLQLETNLELFNTKLACWSSAVSPRCSLFSARITVRSLQKRKNPSKFSLMQHLSPWIFQVNQKGFVGRAIAQAVSRRPPSRRPGFEPGSGHVGFLVNKVALG